MESTLGFAGDEAERSSRDFMSFCAGRAWLLGVVGTNSYGQRLFRFTHRTFYEFFAAESLARQSETADDVCDRIEAAWSRDATSVVPELLVQAYDHSHERGAARVFQQLCSRKAANLLFLRLIGGTILPSYARKAGFDLVTSRWHSATDGADPVEFHSLLTINPQARGQFVADYLRPSLDVDSIALFVESWASLQNSGAGAPVRDAWSGPISAILAEVPLQAITVQMRFSAFDNWAIGTGYQLAVRHDPLTYLLCSGIYGPAPGVIWWTIESVFGGRGILPVNEARTHVVERLHKALTSGHKLSARYVDGLYAVLVAQGQMFVAWAPATKIGKEERQLRDILAIVLASCFERHPEALDFMYATGPVWNHPISGVAIIRQKKILDGEKPTSEEVASARQALEELPGILRAWAIGRRDLSHSD